MSEPQLQDPPVNDPPPKDPPKDPPTDPPADPPKDEFKWPDGWRERTAKAIAGDDPDLVAKYQKQLEQHLDVPSLYKQNIELRKERDSGKLKKALPDNPTDEDLAAYRKSWGIPETPDKYDIKAEGVWGEEENKERFDSLLKFAHENNYTPNQAKALFNHMAKGHQSALDAVAEQDEADKVETEETLRTEFGNDYKINMNLMSGLFDGDPEGTKDEILNARLSDGTKLRNNPEMVKMLVRFAREINPVGAIMPSGSADIKSMDDEYNTLRALQKTDPKKYASKEVQDRLIQILKAKEKIK